RSARQENGRPGGFEGQFREEGRIYVRGTDATEEIGAKIMRACAEGLEWIAGGGAERRGAVEPVGFPAESGVAVRRQIGDRSEDGISGVESCATGARTGQGAAAVD